MSTTVGGTDGAATGAATGAGGAIGAGAGAWKRLGFGRLLVIVDSAPQEAAQWLLQPGTAMGSGGESV